MLRKENVSINVIILSPGLLGFKLFGENTLQTATVTSILTASVLVLLYVIYQFYFQSPVTIPIKDLKTPED